MTVWDLLVSMCFFIATVGSIHAAKAARVGASGYLMAILAGVVIGAGCAFAMWKYGGAIGRRASESTSESSKKWRFRLLYLSSVGWMAISGTLGAAFSAALLRIVQPKG
jgi:hypothetical protein